ncbi:MAG: MgtC/SapB family protein [Thermoguttaceae bacterium]
MEPMFQQLGISLLLGLLVGLQREHAAAGAAGLRTFPLISVLGTVSALLAAQFGGWIVAAGLLGIVAVLVTGHLNRPAGTEAGRGTTTDVAMLLMFAVGALLVMGPAEMKVAVAVGGGVAVLLQFKPELHGIARRLGDEDLKAIMQFVLITCIVLPLLPNRRLALPLPPGYAALDVLNPFEIWLMVVLIVGLGLGGYIFYKFFGRDAGTLLGGVLGGAISSTATTISYARGARDGAGAARAAAVVIMIASTVSCLRVLAAVAVVAPKFLLTVAAPVGVLMVLTLAPALGMWLWHRRQPASAPEHQNPTQLRSAIVFGVMYAVVLLALAGAQKFAGGHGLYAVAGLSGLTEMDAITLSTARMSLGDLLVAGIGWRLIVIAVMANMVSKTVLAGLLGGFRLLGEMALLFAAAMAGGAAMLALR